MVKGQERSYNVPQDLNMSLSFSNSDKEVFQAVPELLIKLADHF